MPIEINYLAVIVGALIYYAGGALWYSPVLFGKTWAELVGFTPEKMEAAKKGVWKSYLTSLISALVISYGLARLGEYLKVDTLLGGLHLGFWSWFCFVLTVLTTSTAFSMKPKKLLFIDSGYHLYGFLVIGIILGVWR